MIVLFYRFALETLETGRIPPLITKEILKYLTHLWNDEEEAKEYRSKARAAMVLLLILLILFIVILLLLHYYLLFD